MQARFRLVQRLLTLALLFASLCALSPRPLAADAGPRWIVAFPSELEPQLRAAGIEIWDRDEGVIVGGAAESTLALLTDLKIEPPKLKVSDEGQVIYILSHDPGFAAPAVPEAGMFPLTATSEIYLLSDDRSFELPRVKPFGGFRGVPRIALPEMKPHAADLAGSGPAHTFSANPLVTQIVGNTSQANWLQYEKDVSGENPVIIGGNTFTISTRYSFVMFPPANNAHASEYLLDKGAGWGYTGVRESYTSTDSGCSQSGQTWQNMVFTLPGQVDFGGHQQVLFVTHYDSLSNNPTVYAPGADDAMSGGSALIEALRLFKDYGFKNTVKIIFFSGEEQGLCGSIAYTHQSAAHPAADIWRVVNMDQTAYDGDLNGFMDDYNWDGTNSPGSVALGQAFVDANATYGPIIPPANIQRPTNKMCQTDHCPFWNIGVAAIAICEDLMHNDICPCFDNTDTASCHDSLTQVDPNHSPRLLFNQNFSWPTEKAAIATVASLAEPLYACPPSAPTPSITPNSNILHLSWATAAGVTNYVVEKASTCAGPFTPLTSTPGTTYDDTNVVNGTSYAYRIRTCPTQTSSCVTAVPSPGPSVVYQYGTAVVTADSGDHDNTPDNCELSTVQVTLQNDGNAPLTNVQLASVSSTHPGVQVVSTAPPIPTLGVGATAPALFKFTLGRNGSSAACFDTIPFSVTVASDQSSPNTRSFSLAAEKDVVASGTLAYGFETDFSGWTVSTGSFTRVAGGAPGSTAFSMHSRNANSVCDAIVSPIVVPTASSTMTMYVNFSIEGTGSGSSNTYDRAVVRAINTQTGAKTLLVPTGTPYNTTGDNTTLCDNIDQLQGWASDNMTWTQASFNLTAFAGIPIQFEVRYASSSSVNGLEGFWFDKVQVTNATQLACDAQSNTCAVPSEVSPPASPVQFTIQKSGASYNLRFSEVSGATRYNLYGGSLASLGTGVYDHTASGGVCSITDGIGGDGQVLTSVASLPDNGYFLAVGANATGESAYGQNSSGAPIPPAVFTCP